MGFSLELHLIFCCVSKLINFLKNPNKTTLAPNLINFL